MDDNIESDCLEISILKSIYGDELQVERSTNDRNCVSVEIKVQPLQLDGFSTASIRIKFLLNDDYPSQPPQILLLQPRGIDDTNLRALNAKLCEYLSNNSGVEVLYDLIQLTQTFIENVQVVPSATCPICLCNFSTKIPSLCTSCEHFVHTKCFSSYIRYNKSEIQRQLDEWPDDMKYKVDQALRCPVCRMELNETDYLTVHSEEDFQEQKDNQDFSFDWNSWKQLQNELKIIYERQLRNGGIIDLGKEKDKNLVTEDTFVAVSSTKASITKPGSSSQKDSLDATGPTYRLERDRGMRKFQQRNDGSCRSNYNMNCNASRGNHSAKLGSSTRNQMKTSDYSTKKFCRKS